MCERVCTSVYAYECMYVCLQAYHLVCILIWLHLCVPSSPSPSDVVRGLKFTVILDGRSAQVKDVQNALKTMQVSLRPHILCGRMYILYTV